MLVRIERNGQIFDIPCELCGCRFRLSDPQPELDGDDGQRRGSVCGECFGALQAGGTAALAARLGTVAECILKNGQRLQAEAAELAKSEIRIEAGESYLPDDPEAKLTEPSQDLPGD